MEPTEEYLRCHKRFEKKNPDELIALSNNFDTYFETLKAVNNPLQIKSGFIHPEPNGIIAVDQSGSNKVLGKKLKLKEVRFYFYIDEEGETVFLLFIGDKQSQSKDINLCKKLVLNLKVKKERIQKESPN